MFERFFQRKAKATASDRERYVELLGIFAGGKWSSTLEEELVGVAERLTIPLDRVQREADAMRKHREASAKGATADQLQAQYQKALAAWQAHEEETQRVVASREPEAEKLGQAADDLRAQHVAAEAAGRQAKELEREFWEILGLPDPSVIARKRYLCWAIDGCNREYPSGIQAVPMCHLLSDCAWLQGIELVQAPGQAESEFDELSRLVTGLIDGTIARSDVLLVADDPARYPNVGVFVAPVAELIGEMGVPSPEGKTRLPAFNPARKTWVRLPGQSQIELDTLRQRVQKAYDANPHIREQREQERREANARAEG